MKKAVLLMQKAQISIAGGFLLIFMITILIQIFARGFKFPVLWTQEVASYSFIWSLFMGAGAMVYEKRHFAFTSFSDMLKDPKIKTVLSIIISIVMLIFSILMVYYGIILTEQFWSFKWQSIPMFNRGPTWLCVPICGITSVIYLLGHIIDDVKRLGGKS